jgi:hypothetical protein
LDQLLSEVYLNVRTLDELAQNLQLKTYDHSITV